MKRAAVFFDRDNTLIANDGYLGDPDGVVLIDGAADAIARVRQMGFAVVTFSNQSGVARGMFTEEAVHAVNARLDELLVEENPKAVISRHEFCPFHPEAAVEKYRVDSDLRKPRPGMILQAATRLGLDISKSWVIGDAPRDIEAGKAVGCRTLLFRDPNLKASSAATEASAVEAEFTVATLKEAVDRIAKEALGIPMPSEVPPIAETPQAPQASAPLDPEVRPMSESSPTDDLAVATNAPPQASPVPPETSGIREDATSTSSSALPSGKTKKPIVADRATSQTSTLMDKKAADGKSPGRSATEWAAKPSKAQTASNAKATVVVKATRKPTFAERVRAGTFVPAGKEAAPPPIVEVEGVSEPEPEPLRAASVLAATEPIATAALPRASESEPETRMQKLDPVAMDDVAGVVETSQASVPPSEDPGLSGRISRGLGSPPMSSPDREIAAINQSNGQAAHATGLTPNTSSAIVDAAVEGVDLSRPAEVIYGTPAESNDAASASPSDASAVIAEANSDIGIVSTETIDTPLAESTQHVAASVMAPTKPVDSLSAETSTASVVATTANAASPDAAPAVQEEAPAVAVAMKKARPTTMAIKSDPPPPPAEAVVSAASIPASARKPTFADRVKAGSFTPAKPPVAVPPDVAATPVPEKTPRALGITGERPQGRVGRVVELLTATRPTEPVPPAEQLEPVLQDILEELRLARQDRPESEFSITKLMAGIVQVLVLPALFFAYLHRDVPADCQTMLILATFLQTLVIALAVMGKQR